MADVIDFQIERAVRKSGIRDKALIRDIIDEGYDPCNSVDMINYYNWKEFESQVFTQVEHNWTDEAIEQLMRDVALWNDTDNTTVTVEYDPNIFFSEKD